MSRQSIPRIITNRQLNFTLSPVDTHNPKPMPYSLQNYEIDGTWNNHQSIILDCILDRIFRATYKQHKKLPQSWRSKKVIEMINGYSGGIITPETLKFLDLSPRDAFIKQNGEDIFEKIKQEYEYTKGNGSSETFKQFVEHYHYKEQFRYEILEKKMLEANQIVDKDLLLKFNIKNFLENYPVINQYKYTLAKLLKRIEATKFKMNYKVKYMERQPSYDENGKITERGKLIDMHYQMLDFQHIFLVTVNDDIITFNFNTPLAKLIIYNMLILDTDWIPVDALNLSKNAYFLYKRFVLSKRSGRFKASKIELKFEDLKTFLDLKWSNNRGIHALIEKALNDMKQNGLIDSFVCNKNIVNRRAYELYFEEKKQKQQKQKDDDGKLLKMVV